MSRPCQAEDSDGDECDCETFAPKSKNPKQCRYCLHAGKHHPKQDDTIASILLKAKDDHRGEPGAEMFSVTKKVKAEEPTLTKMSQAKRETMEGMRPNNHARLSKKDLVLSGKPGKNRTGRPAREPVSVAMFKVDGFIILAEGLRKKGTNLVLADDGIPSKARIQNLINQGLAVRKDGGIGIPVSATHEEIVDILSDNLPLPMVFFDHLGPTIFTDPYGGEEILSAPGYVLFTRVRQRLEVVQITHPTGRDFQTHLGPKNATENRFIYLAARTEIPRSERASWRTTNSLAFTLPSSETAGSEEEEAQDTTPPKPKVTKATKKRKRSLTVEDSDDGLSLFAVEDRIQAPALKLIEKRNFRKVARKSYFDDDRTLPSILTDSIAQELSTASGASMSHNNATAGPSDQPIDLTGTSHSPSPGLPSFMRTFLTPEPTALPITDSTFSPVEHTYVSGPRALRKFF
ncbi:hypothetical protein DFH07DRAFT_768108 [Mycena maculata]|uniref:Uncharacterized protein n=1 Tax=Mycena maculata TaxID=230809 RepID=A0AAD7JU32_9AGAR|nr:hypothetical protein DFH07DRAFT_768108 [Mycena maculata]